jgi:hypothetical protein
MNLQPKPEKPGLFLPIRRQKQQRPGFGRPSVRFVIFRPRWSKMLGVILPGIKADWQRLSGSTAIFQKKRQRSGVFPEPVLID